jgi:hypothetical protein
MSLKEMIFGRGVAVQFPDASPEQRESIMRELNNGSTSPAVVPVPVTPSPAAVTPAPVAIAVDAAHAALSGAIDAINKGDKKSLAKHRAALSQYLEEEKKEPSHKKRTIEHLEKLAGDEAADVEDEAEDAEDAEDEAMDAEDEEVGDEEVGDEDEAGDEEVGDEEAEDTAVDAGKAEKQIDDPGQSVLKAANDSFRSFLRISRPMVASIVNKPKSKRSRQEQLMVDSFNKAVKNINKASGKVYSVLSKSRIPDGIPGIATDSSAITKDDHGSCNCFDGVPYRIGLKKHEEHLAKEKK